MNTSIKKEQIKSWESLVVGKTYHIAKAPALTGCFSGTAVFDRQSPSSYPGNYVFKNLAPDDENQASLATIAKYNSGMGYWLDAGRGMKSRVSEIISVNSSHGDKVKTFDDLVVGKTYYISHIGGGRGAFSGTARFWRKDRPLYCFGELAPDIHNAMSEEAICSFNERRDYHLTGNDIVRLFEVESTIETTTNSVPSTPEPTMSLEESERMIKEIQEAYECLD